MYYTSSWKCFGTSRIKAVALLTDATIQKKIIGSETTALIISIEEMKDIIKIVNSLGESSLLIKGVSETIKNEAKEQKVEFLGILLGALAASFLGNMLAGKPKISGQGKGKYLKWWRSEFLMLSHPLKYKILKYKNKSKWT